MFDQTTATRLIVATILVGLLTGSLWFKKDWRTFGSTISTFSTDATAAAAPELSSGAWINSEPLTIRSLKGRVVLLEFWTFGCYTVATLCRSLSACMKGIRQRVLR